MRKWFQFDELTENVSGKVALVCLVLTQLGLYLAIVYQRYIQGLPPEYYNDLAILMILSVAGFWASGLYLGGILPRLSLRVALGIYAILVAAIGIPHTLVHGLPSGNEWVTRLLGIFIAPAVLVAVYSWIAYAGYRRMEKRSLAPEN